MPSSFKIFRVLNREVDLFRPLVLDATDREQSINVYAKLKPDVSLDSARAQMRTVYSSLPIPDHLWTAGVALLTTSFAANSRPILLALEWAAALVLLIACANIANLLLAVSAGRRKELAIRQALGASRWQIARDLAGEPLILTVAGGAFAILLATWIVAALNAAVSFQEINRLHAFRVDAWVLAFTVGLTLAVTLFFGLLPAHAAADADVVDALKDSTHGVTTGMPNRRLRYALIVGELALSIVLTASALTLARSALALQSFTRGVIDAAALVNYPPLSMIRVGVPVTIEGQTPPPGQLWMARYWVAAPGYFHTAGIRLLVGRDFTSADDRTRGGVAIVSETFARRFWNTTDVVGRRLRPTFPKSNAFWIPRVTGEMLTIVGVVGDVREDGLPDAAGLPQLYLHTRRTRRAR